MALLSSWTSKCAKLALRKNAACHGRLASVSLSLLAKCDELSSFKKSLSKTAGVGVMIFNRLTIPLWMRCAAKRCHKRSSGLHSKRQPEEESRTVRNMKSTSGENGVDRPNDAKYIRNCLVYGMRTWLHTLYACILTFRLSSSSFSPPPPPLSNRN